MTIPSLLGKIYKNNQCIGYRLGLTTVWTVYIAMKKYMPIMIHLICNHHLFSKGWQTCGPTQKDFKKYHKSRYNFFRMIYFDGYTHGWNVTVSLKLSKIGKNVSFRTT